MQPDPSKRKRRSIRLQGYDYSHPGRYFFTIVTRNHLHLFGDIKNSKMIVNNIGELVQKCWLDIPIHFPNVDLDECIVMPNHFHGILFIVNNDVVGAQHAVPLRKYGDMIACSLPTIVRSNPL